MSDVIFEIPDQFKDFIEISGEIDGFNENQESTKTIRTAENFYIKASLQLKSLYPDNIILFDKLKADFYLEKMGGPDSHLASYEQDVLPQKIAYEFEHQIERFTISPGLYRLMVIFYASGELFPLSGFADLGVVQYYDIES